MSEIKFACPHCRQHIACDAGYCGYEIRCPTCDGAMIAPKLAAFGFGAPGPLSLAVPVATPISRVAAATGMSWNRQAWTGREHTHEATPEEPSDWEIVSGFVRNLVIGALVLMGFAVLALGLLFAGCALTGTWLSD